MFSDFVLLYWSVVMSTIRKLKAKDVAVALEDDDAEDIDDDDVK